LPAGGGRGQLGRSCQPHVSLEAAQRSLVGASNWGLGGREFASPPRLSTEARRSPRNLLPSSSVARHEQPARVVANEVREGHLRVAFSLRRWHTHL
jgi:hypothetical protein